MNVWSERARLPRVCAAIAAAAGALLLFHLAAAETPTPSATPSIAGSSTPAPAGTPWPAPTGLRLEGHWVLLDDLNYPLPPEKQVRYSGASWAVLSGFTGTYEVQHAVRSIPLRPLAEDPYEWLPVAAGPFPASSAAEGRIGFEEQVELFKVHCYRVRAVISGEIGPYSEPICSPAPPTTAPAAPSQTASPLPPDVGNTPLTAAETGWLALAAAVAFTTLCGAAALALGRR